MSGVVCRAACQVWYAGQHVRCGMQGSMSGVICRVVCVNNVTTVLPVQCVLHWSLSTFLQSTALYLHITL